MICLLTSKVISDHTLKVSVQMLCRTCSCCCLVCSVLSNSLWPHELYPARLLCPWDSPGKNTGVGCHFLLLGNLPMQGLNPHLLHCRWIVYHWATREALNLLSTMDILEGASQSKPHKPCRCIPALASTVHPTWHYQGVWWGLPYPLHKCQVWCGCHRQDFIQTANIDGLMAPPRDYAEIIISWWSLKKNA